MKKNVIWKDITLNPSIQLKHGINRKIYPLKTEKMRKKSVLHFQNQFVKLEGKWDNSPGFGALLGCKLKNISDSSLRLTRLLFSVEFPAENSTRNSAEARMDFFLRDVKPGNISFLRNGYQSWSLSRSYRLRDKPLKPWLQVVSVVSDNLANPPSSNSGNLSSEMYTVISNLSNDESFFAGQGPPFCQFFYIRLIIYSSGLKKNRFELIYDFGRKLILPGETITLDRIILARGISEELLARYFRYIKSELNIKIKKENITGWSSWYYYYNKISYDKIIQNLDILYNRKIPLQYVQIDDGYQKMVGDWLDLKDSFKDRMKILADAVESKGFSPGIWLAPFTADRKSRLVKNHPEYVLRNEYGIPLLGGVNITWPGRFYYGLDITHPRFEEYMRKVIKTIVREWGFKYLKLDFMYCACLRGGTHYNLRMSRAEVLKYGMKVIREEAGDHVVLNGCGMPLTPGIGYIDSMRIGQDTAPRWYKNMEFILRTGAMSGLRNSIRNNFVRNTMNRSLWINDPDCLLLRHTKTALSRHERRTQINAAVITGGALFLSDDLKELPDTVFDELRKAIHYSNMCFSGRPVTLDLMSKAVPELIYNTEGFLGIFNMKNRCSTKTINLNSYTRIKKAYTKLINIWTDEHIPIPSNGCIRFRDMPPHSSLLFKLR